jgi:hypothetical protein
MRYFRVQWTDSSDVIHLSDPLMTWIDAANYRAELISTGVRAPVTILSY